MIVKLTWKIEFRIITNCWGKGFYISTNNYCSHFCLECTKIVVGWGSAPDPAGGAYSAPPDPLAVWGWDRECFELCTPSRNPIINTVNMRRQSIADVHRNVIISWSLNGTNLIFNNNFKKIENGYHGSGIVKNFIICYMFLRLNFVLWKIKMFMKWISVLKLHDFQCENYKNFQHGDTSDPLPQTVKPRPPLSLSPQFFFQRWQPYGQLFSMSVSGLATSQHLYMSRCCDVVKIVSGCGKMSTACLQHLQIVYSNSVANPFATKNLML